MKLHIILVEDNEMNRELVHAIFEEDEHKIEDATDGASLRALISAGSAPDIVLMDIALPDIDGVALLHELRTLGHFDGVPIVALTAHALVGDKTRLLAAGFDAVLTKPINTRTFSADVARLASLRIKGAQ